MTITVGSLFSGIGGLDLGLERARMQIRWQVEIDDYCTKVLEKHWPGVARFRDVRECGRQNLEPVDLICGGFPCQDVSLAGKQAGLKGTRTTLWSEFARIIGDLRPQWVLAENVPGLLSSDAGRFFGAVLRDLAACGYNAEWDCISAAAFGAPHRRDRVWIVAHAARQHGAIVGQPASEPGRSGKTLAYTSSGGARRLSVRQGRSQQAEADVVGRCEDVANARSIGRQTWSTDSQTGEEGLTDQSNDGSQVLADTKQNPVFYDQLHDEQDANPLWSDWWATEPDVGRVAHGISRRMDRLRGLGNAVVPQIAEWIGRRIIKAGNNGH